ncbi:MAG: hypothetical protein ISS16_11035 [Ignavibacteria bacterium]|nr:hypothetical protein [Ignavibacteria bacterium]
MNNYKQVLLNLPLILLTVILISCNASQELKEGTYTSTEKSVDLSIRLYGGNKYKVLMEGETVVEGIYEIKDNRLIITDKKGSHACLDNPTATYRWKIKDNEVTLMAISDECSGRKAALTSQSFIME